MVDLAEGRRLLEANGGDRKVALGKRLEPGDWTLLIWLRNNAAELIDLAEKQAELAGTWFE